MKGIISFIFGLILLGVAIATSTVEITTPTSFVTSDSTSINVTATFNISGFPYLASTGLNWTNATINVNILNKSSISGAYGILAESLSRTITVSNGTDVNASYFNQIITLANEQRHWIKINFTNVSRADNGDFGGALTTERIIQIDADYNIFPFNVYNFSYITADGSKSYCGVSDANVWSCSS